MRKQRPSQPNAPASASSEQQMDHKPLAARRSEIRKQQRSRRRQNAVGAGLAVLAGRSAGALSRRLHLGGGTSIAGIVAQRVYPNIVEHLAAQLEHGSVVITGTNGKTTTSSLIAAILRDSGLRVWHNREGSNLMRGVATTLVIRALPNGHLRGKGSAISILEVDEAALPQVVEAVEPRVVVFNNLFRDQLDRYGEVDSVISHWKRAIATLPEGSMLILNADDPAIASLGINFPGKIIYYGIAHLAANLQARPEDENHQVIDTRNCPRCGGEFAYDMRFYSHIGHYRCINCDWVRPTPDIAVEQAQLDDFDRWRVQVHYGEHQQELVIPLPGLYNIYNALAAIAATSALHASWKPIVSGIEQATPVFGRGERIEAEGRTMRLLLAKNPTGLNEVLRTLFSEKVPRHVLFLLNDNTADGHDISWIWDVDFERAVGYTSSLTISGTRARDLALRMKYAGVPVDELTVVPYTPLRGEKQSPIGEGRTRRSRRSAQEVVATIDPNADAAGAERFGLKAAIDTALHQTPEGETLFVVPTYTGLLELHRELEQRGLTPHYWKE